MDDTLSKPIIVMKTNGKHDSVDNITVKVFYDINEANEYCEKNTDKEEEKYWSFCEIIQEGVKYQPIRYGNINCEY